MRRTAPPDAVNFADIQFTNNGPTLPKIIKAPEVWTFDPGTQIAGISIARRGKIKHANALRMSSGEDDTVGFRVQELGGLVRKFFASCGIVKAPPGTVVVVEFPMIYTTGPMVGKVNPRDILWVSAAVGAFLANMPAGVKEIRDVTPNYWKGNRDKVANNMLTLEGLFPDEKAMLPRLGAVKTNRKGDSVPEDDDNMLDAVGINLHYLNRVR